MANKIILDFDSKEKKLLSLETLEEMFKGKLVKRPLKVLNPDPNINYTGEVLEVVGQNNKKNFTFHIEEDIIKTTNKQDSFHLSFDVNDVDSFNLKNKDNGRISFQYEDITMPKGKPNYRRILFFYAHDTKVVSIDKYFENSTVIYDSKGRRIKTFLDNDGNLSGFAYIYDNKGPYYYFANFKNGKLHGFVFKFTCSKSGKEYVFENVSIYNNGNLTNILANATDQLEFIKNKYELTVISWS